MNYLETLQQLCAVPAPSGFEARAAQAALALLRPWMDEAYVDKMGTLVGVRRCGKPGAKRLLLDAHLDEIGLVVTGHQDGFLRFAPLGGVDPRMLPDREVLLLTQPPIPAVVACLPPHIQSREEMDRSTPIRELYLDAGLTREEAQTRIPIGTPAVYRGGCGRLGDKLLCGKALDDRAGFAVLLDAVERLVGEELDVDLYVLGSTQEETHSTGAITAAYAIAPHWCVAVDVTHGDSPDASRDKTFPLGGGPVIGLGPNCTRWMARRLEARAGELELPVQYEVMAGSSGTNGWPLQISREGVATAVLSIPLRYMHTPIETVHEDDLADTAKLLAAFIRHLGEEAPGDA